MIFSCTKKVLDKLKKHKTIETTKEEVGFYNWYIDLVNLNRKNYFLFTNSKTMFSFFIYAGTKKELSNIETLFEMQLQEQIIRNISPSETILDAAFPIDNTHRFMKTNSSKVLGYMNDFKYQLNVQVEYRGLTPETYPKINYLISDIPLGSMKYSCSRDLMEAELKMISINRKQKGE